MKPVMTFLKYLWPSPYTFLGLLIGSVGVLTGGKMRIRDGVFECWGGFTTFLVACLPPGFGDVLAATIGHVVIGQSEAAIDFTREHERVHVRQFERWGMIFLPVYLTASLIAWWQGKRPYRDNVFEAEAYAVKKNVSQNPE